MRVPKTQANILVSLMFAHLLLANTTFKFLQVVVELVLALCFLLPLLNCRFTEAEIVIAFTYVAAMAASLFVNDLAVTFLNAKIFGLAILTLFFFSRAEIDDNITTRVVVMNIAFTVYLAFVGSPSWFTYFVSHFGRSWAELAVSRPLGIFLSTHASAFVSAVFLLYLSYRRRAYSVVGLVLLYLNASFFVLVSYVGQLGAILLKRLRIAKPIYFVVAVSVPLAFLNADRIINFDLATVSSVFGPREQISYSVIIAQVLDWQAYARAFTLIPRDTYAIATVFTNQGNEIGYFTLLQQGGFVLSSLYLWRLFARTKGFRAFLAISMLHYGMATTPIGIYLMIHFSLMVRKTALLPSAREPRVTEQDGLVAAAVIA